VLRLLVVWQVQVMSRGPAPGLANPGSAHRRETSRLIRRSLLIEAWVGGSAALSTV